MEIETLPDLAREAEAYRQVFNHIRPHEALDFHRPIEVYRDPPWKPNPRSKIPNLHAKNLEPGS
jgi:putative transposase